MKELWYNNDDEDEDYKKKPWWNDPDVVGGMAATISVIGLAVMVSLLMIGFGIYGYNKLSGN